MGGGSPQPDPQTRCWYRPTRCRRRRRPAWRAEEEARRKKADGSPLSAGLGTGRARVHGHQFCPLWPVIARALMPSKKFGRLVSTAKALEGRAVCMSKSRKITFSHLTLLPYPGADRTIRDFRLPFAFPWHSRIPFPRRSSITRNVKRPDSR